MELTEALECRMCKNKNFDVKRTVTYTYTYKFNSHSVEDVSVKTKELPFLFDNREKSSSYEFIICENCGAKYPIELDEQGSDIDLTILRKAIRSDSTVEPQFKG